MKIKITFASSQSELAHRIAAKLAASIPGAKVHTDAPKDNGKQTEYTHIYLDDGRRW